MGFNFNYSLVQPKSGFVHIRMESDCPRSILQLFISDLCVHKRSIVFTEYAYDMNITMVMPLPCYAYAKNNSNSNADVPAVKTIESCPKHNRKMWWFNGYNGNCIVLM